MTGEWIGPIYVELMFTFRGVEHWRAIDERTFDGARSPVGRGHSKAEALADLQEQLENTGENDG